MDPIIYIVGIIALVFILLCMSITNAFDQDKEGVAML